MSDISVVVVNWNTRDLIDECLQSVAAELAGVDHEVIVVDNGSSDGSIEHLATFHPRVDVVELPENLGYQAACNIGSRKASAPLMLHINTDARLTAGAFDTMHRVLTEHPEVGVVGPRLVYGDGSFQRWTAGQLPTLGSLTHSFVLGDRFGDKGLWTGDDHDRSGPVGWVSSACLMVRSKVFDDIGGLDERFFAYMDDVDLCERSAELGYTTWYEPSATVVHLMGGSGSQKAGASSMAVASMGKWFRLRHGPVQGAAAGAIMAAGFSLRATSRALRSDIDTAKSHLGSARIALRSGVGG